MEAGTEVEQVQAVPVISEDPPKVVIVPRPVSHPPSVLQVSQLLPGRPQLLSHHLCWGIDLQFRFQRLTVVMDHPPPFHWPSDLLICGDFDFDRNIRLPMPRQLSPNEKRFLSAGMRVILDLALTVQLYLGILNQQVTGFIARPDDGCCQIIARLETFLNPEKSKSSEKR